MILSTRFILTLSLLFGAALFAAEEPAPEPGEHALNAAETDAALKRISAIFKTHPTIRAKIRSEIEDLTGKRVEEGTLLLDRTEGQLTRVLRTFANPKPKAWLLNGATISQFVPSKKAVFVKDLSAVPKTLKHIQAAMTGDVKALDEIFTIRIFAKPDTWRLVLDKKPAVSKYIHRRIEARLAEHGVFFDSIHYIPDEGDELTETFLDAKDAGKLSDADFVLPGAEGVERKVEKISE
jgi:hypothetical protein